MLVDAIYAYLAADSGVTALLGNARADKQTGIWPVHAPDEPAVPWIVYSQVSGQPLQTSFQGTGRLHTARVRFACHGSTYKQAKQLAQAIKQAMISASGTMPGASSQTYMSGAWQVLEMDDAEPLPRGTIFSTHLDFMCVYTDTAGL
jgi:hypothetical protein